MNTLLARPIASHFRAQLDPGSQLDPDCQCDPGYQCDPGFRVNGSQVTPQADPGTVTLGQADPGNLTITAQADPTRLDLALAA